MTLKERSRSRRQHDPRFRSLGGVAHGGFKAGTANGPEPTTLRGKRRKHKEPPGESKAQHRLAKRIGDYEATVDMLKRKDAGFVPESYRRPGSMQVKH